LPCDGGPVEAGLVMATAKTRAAMIYLVGYFDIHLQRIMAPVLNVAVDQST
jgi:hypothetical protein